MFKVILDYIASLRPPVLHDTLMKSRTFLTANSEYSHLQWPIEDIGYYHYP